MKIKELSGDISINNIKVKLPDFWYESLTQFGDDLPKEVWLVGGMMGDWFVRKEYADTQVFPLFTEFAPSDLLEWEVVEIKNVEK